MYKAILLLNAQMAYKRTTKLPVQRIRLKMYLDLDLYMLAIAHLNLNFDEKVTMQKQATWSQTSKEELALNAV